MGKGRSKHGGNDHEPFAYLALKRMNNPISCPETPQGLLPTLGIRPEGCYRNEGKVGEDDPT